jgi:hypothetical protein
MKLLHPIKTALLGMIAILIVSQGCAQRSESESHVVQEGNTVVEYFSQGQGDVVVLLPGGGLSMSAIWKAWPSRCPRQAIELLSIWMWGHGCF